MPLPDGIRRQVHQERKEDSYAIRRAALDYHIPYCTTITGATAVTKALVSLMQKEAGVMTIQESSKRID